MLGFYDYTVVLTYCSVISAVIGSHVSLSGYAGHPYIGVMLLLLCGLLLITFDGREGNGFKRRIVTREGESFRSTD
ncbi:MAG: hypothetical protein ACLRR3_04220 [Eubacterium sp.]